MSTIQAEIHPILKILPLPNADELEIVQILGTQCIVRKGVFTKGQLAVYFPPNLLIPEEVSKNLGVHKYLKGCDFPGKGRCSCRVGAIRLRGEASFGFALPASDFAFKAAPEAGQCVDHYFGSMKYEPPVRLVGKTPMAPDVPTFHKYTSIENYYRFPTLIPSATMVRITEKRHGCLHLRSHIYLPDGSKKKVNELRRGDEVLGVNSLGELAATKVLNIFDNGPCDEWLTVKTTRTGLNRGNSFVAVYCTPNHKFWSPSLNEYIAASDLTPGDHVLSCRSDIELNPAQKQVLLGKMLGDGHISIHGNSAHISFGHKESSNLTEWTVRALGDLCTPMRDSQISGYGTEMLRAATKSWWAIKTYFSDFVVNGTKQVPDWVEQELAPLGLAFWYMDDGSLNHQADQQDRAEFATCGFSVDSCKILQRALMKFGIASTLSNRDYPRIHLNSDDAEKFFLLVAPYIPPSLQHKLPERYRGHAGWVPENCSQYKALTCVQQVLEVSPFNCRPGDSSKWDIETETHNYFANGVLTHNSNSRAGLVRVNGEFAFVAGSHNVNRKDTEGCTYWEPMSQGMLALLTELCDEKNDVIVFGEIFGPGIQDMDYGVENNQVGFEVFDISVNGKYLDWLAIWELCPQYGLKTVPILYIGPFSDEIVKKYTDGPTMNCPEPKSAFKQREGVVITPMHESVNQQGKRMILKSVSCDYLARKGGQDND